MNAVALATDPPKLTLDMIATRIGCRLSANFLRGVLGFHSEAPEGEPELYSASNWRSICDAFIAQVKWARDEFSE